MEIILVEIPDDRGGEQHIVWVLYEINSALASVGLTPPFSVELRTKENNTFKSITGLGGGPNVNTPYAIRHREVIRADEAELAVKCAFRMPADTVI